MDKQTPRTEINAGLQAFGGLPMSGFCSCPSCGQDDLLRKDMAGLDKFRPNQLQSALDLYAAPICANCLDDHEKCQNCGNITNDTHYCDAEDMHVGECCLVQEFVSDAYGYRNLVAE